MKEEETGNGVYIEIPEGKTPLFILEIKAKLHIDKYRMMVNSMKAKLERLLGRKVRVVILHGGLSLKAVVEGEDENTSSE